MTETPLIFARRSSHMSRVALLFAEALGVAYELRVVPDLTSTKREDYGGHPSLKIPVVHLVGQPHYGALNICRALWKLSGERVPVLWPEQMDDPLLSNALEVTLNGMASEITLIMDRMGRAADATGEPSAAIHKARASLAGGVAWLEARLPEILAARPARPSLRYLDVCLFCFVDHLEWREVLELDDVPRLRAFRDDYAQQPAAAATTYRFDAS